MVENQGRQEERKQIRWVDKSDWSMLCATVCDSVISLNHCLDSVNSLNCSTVSIQRIDCDTVKIPWV